MGKGGAQHAIEHTKPHPDWQDLEWQSCQEFDLGLFVIERSVYES